MTLRRVLVADDDAMVRDAYRAFFARQSEFELTAEARNGVEAIEAYEKVLPDLVLMDLQMPVMTGVEAIGELCRRWPDAKVVALTTFGSLDYIVAALRAGASGYMVKDAGGPALLAGMRQALAGEMPLSASVRHELVGAMLQTAPPPAPVDAPELTPRERELLECLAQGFSNQQISKQMFVSEGSVKQYLAHIGTKLKVSSRTQILVKAIQLNLIDPRELPPV